MKYTASESLRQVLSRRDQLKRKRERRRLALCSLSLCVLLVVLTLSVASTPIAAQSGGNEAAMGSFLLEAQTGGIIAAVVLAFLLGVLITLLCIRKNRTREHTDVPHDAERHENGGNRL